MMRAARIDPSGSREVSSAAPHSGRRNSGRIGAGCLLMLGAVVSGACGADTGQPGHTFELVEHDGVPVAINSAIPKYDGEIFHYEMILEIRPDPDNFDETYLYQPRSLTLGDDGLYYVADNGNDRIAVFDGEGNFVRAFGGEGQGPGEMQGPVWVDVENGIATVRAQRISRFRTDGTFLDVLTWEGGGGVRLADNGTRVVIDLPQGPHDDGYYYLQARARVLDDDGNVVATIESPDVASARMMPDSELGRATLHYAAWPTVTLVSSNEILVSPGDQPVLSWYGLDGGLKRRARIDLPPEPITETDRAAVADRYDRLIEHNLRFGAGEQLRDMLLKEKEIAQYPENKAFWWRHHVEEPAGWLWLSVPVPTFAVYTRGAPRIAQQQSFRIVSPEGEYIGVTHWPPEVDSFATNVVRGHLLAMVPDPETEEEVPTVYRITPAVEGLEYPGNTP